MTELPPAVEVQAPPRFRKKPIEVRAIQWTGDNRSDVEALAGGKFEEIDPIDRHMLDDPEASASLLAAPHGSWVLVYTGDWIVRDDRGAFTRCADADFREAYDVAPEPLELTPAEQAAKAKHPHMSTCHDRDCQECVREIAANRRTIKAVRPVIEADARADERLALGAAGRLLPEGCERTSEFQICWLRPDESLSVLATWGTDSLERVRELLTEPPAGAEGYTVEHREHWTSQYVPVDPKALEPVETQQ
ncbi:MAG: hypothetical protein JWO67_143 [Streptosporangiaceae bacterium]|nr:hypothetical protein [Streptosporangiaceae bacterium]